MGIVRMGPPEELVLLIKNQKAISTFVETGTYFGNTAFWASEHFKNVITIERAESMYAQALQSYKHVKNIEFRLGDSSEELRNFIPTLKKPAIFWLDSHWSGGETFGKDDECPLLKELETFEKSLYEHALMIDDARLFSSPPPLPHKKEQWPTLMQILDGLKRIYADPYIVIFEDVLICVPSDLKTSVSSYCQDKNTQQWKKYSQCQTEVTSTNEKRSLKRILANVVKKVFPSDPPDLSRNYMDPGIPAKQRQLVDQQLEKMYQGDVAPHFQVLADAFAKLQNGENPLRVLDAGCASAYYSEILEYLLSRPLNYVGSDFNAKMLEMARQKYPALPFFRMDLRRLAWRDSSFDVVMSGAVIVHIKEWQKAVSEIARVTKKYMILHRTRVRIGKGTMIKEESHYDVQVYRVSIGEKELLDHLNALNFELVSRIDCYEGELEEGIGNFTYLFLRKEH